MGLRSLVKSAKAQDKVAYRAVVANGESVAQALSTALVKRRAATFQACLGSGLLEAWRNIIWLNAH